MNYFEYGNKLYSEKEYIKAINTYKKSIEFKENLAPSLYNTAVCFIKLKNYKKAIPLLKGAIKTREDSKYFFNLGYCYAMLKNSKKALIYFNTAWTLNNDDTDCEKAINVILNSLKRN